MATEDRDIFNQKLAGEACSRCLPSIVLRGSGSEKYRMPSGILILPLSEFSCFESLLGTVFSWGREKRAKTIMVEGGSRITVLLEEIKCKSGLCFVLEKERLYFFCGLCNYSHGGFRAQLIAPNFLSMAGALARSTTKILALPSCVCVCLWFNARGVRFRAIFLLFPDERKTLYKCSVSFLFVLFE